jgi:hypothetical protein
MKDGRRQRSGIKSLLASALLAVSSASSACAATQHWIAVSNTAISITGDIQFNPPELIFENHAKLKVSLVGNAKGLTWADWMRDRTAQVMAVNGKHNPRLLNGNYLCGAATRPTFVSILEDKGEVYLTVFNGETPPAAADFAARICAGFSYSLK